MRGSCGSALRGPLFSIRCDGRQRRVDQMSPSVRPGSESSWRIPPEIRFSSLSRIWCRRNRNSRNGRRGCLRTGRVHQNAVIALGLELNLSINAWPWSGNHARRIIDRSPHLAAGRSKMSQQASEWQQEGRLGEADGFRQAANKCRSAIEMPPDWFIRRMAIAGGATAVTKTRSNPSSIRAPVFRMMEFTKLWQL